MVQMDTDNASLAYGSNVMGIYVRWFVAHWHRPQLRWHWPSDMFFELKQCVTICYSHAI